MIGRLTGKLLADEIDTIVLDVNGVGYEVIVPVGTLGRTPQDPEGRITLYIHTHVREDTLSLFGFSSESDRLAFRTLIGVSSVGPKTAVAVLGTLPAHELARAIAAKDMGRLTGVPGIGKKTAERLILELRDKLPVVPLPIGETPIAAHKAAPGKSGGDVLVSALVNMGYRPAEAERAAASLEGRLDSTPLPVLLKEALAVLSK